MVISFRVLSKQILIQILIWQDTSEPIIQLLKFKSPISKLRNISIHPVLQLHNEIHMFQLL